MFGSPSWARTSDTLINSQVLLPTELSGNNLERGKRIELSALAWKAKVLPLYEPRINLGAGCRD